MINRDQIFQDSHPNDDADFDITQNYLQVRKISEDLCQPLAIEDFVIQGMPDVSPPKWHLAHTTWFFEHFLLKYYVPNYKPYHPQYHYLFNSYYTTAGQIYPRTARGLLSRPRVEEVYSYRSHVDKAMVDLLATRVARTDPELNALVTLGINHEQQHQELLLTDIKYNFYLNPLRPSYAKGFSTSRNSEQVENLTWTDCASGMQEIGSNSTQFGFDNERPRHRVYVNAFRIGNRLITNEEYLRFIHAGGYHTPAYWLADGWDAVQAGGLEAPLYWELQAGQWQVFTLHGMRSLELNQPVSHISYFEADAYARWQGSRLPTEAEWETVAALHKLEGNLLESGVLQAVPGKRGGENPQQLFGDVWEWTQSPYLPYHGYTPLASSLGEYNGKFMCNQYVLRGGSCFTPTNHIRASYRNFFYPSARWQCSGIRLVQSRHD